MSSVFYWSPRILAMAFALFLAVFALDSHGPVELLMHLVPSMLVLLALAIAWRREGVGAVIFLALAALYILLWGRFPVTTYAVIAGPLALIGLLFVHGARRSPAGAV